MIIYSLLIIDKNYSDEYFFIIDILNCISECIITCRYLRKQYVSFGDNQVLQKVIRPLMVLSRKKLSNRLFGLPSRNISSICLRLATFVCLVAASYMHVHVHHWIQYYQLWIYFNEYGTFIKLITLLINQIQQRFISITISAVLKNF